MHADSDSPETLAAAIHHVIWDVAREHFVAQRWDDAIFAAFRKVEATVQSRVNSQNIGGTLIDQAFNHSAATPAIDISSDPRDTFSLNALYRGALGFFKGDRSHGDEPAVPCRDQETCLRILGFASLLLDLLDLDANITPAIVALRAEEQGTIQIYVARSTPQTEVLVDGLPVAVVTRAVDTIRFRLPVGAQAPMHLWLRDGSRTSPQFSLDFLPTSASDANFHKIEDVEIHLFDTAQGSTPLAEHAILLRSYESGRSFLRYFPSDKSYQPGDYVSWDWDMSRGVGNAWVRRGGDVAEAWAGSAYFAGRVLGRAGKPSLTAIELRPAKLRMRKDERLPLRVVGFFKDGPATWREDVTDRAVFQVADEKVGRLANGPSIRAAGMGSSTVTARVGGLFSQSPLLVTALASGEMTEYLGGLLTVTAMVETPDGLIIANKQDRLWVVRPSLALDVLTTVEVPDTFPTGLDHLTADKDANLYVRTLWDNRRVLRLEHSSGFTKATALGELPEATSVMGLLWTPQRGLIVAASDGVLWTGDGDKEWVRWTRLPVAAIAMANTEDKLWAVAGGGRSGYMTVRWDSGEVSIEDGQSTLLVTPSSILARENDVLIADFHSGRLYSVTDGAMALVSDGLGVPTALAIRPSGDVLVADFSSDRINRVLH